LNPAVSLRSPKATKAPLTPHTVQSKAVAPASIYIAC